MSDSSVRTLINVRFSILWAGVNRVALVDHISSLSLLFPLGLGMDFGDLLPTRGQPPDPENKYRQNVNLLFLLIGPESEYWLLIGQQSCWIFTWISIHFKHVNCEFVLSLLGLNLISQVHKPWETKLYILNIYFWASHSIQEICLVICFHQHKAQPNYLNKLEFFHVMIKSRSND